VVAAGSAIGASQSDSTGPVLAFVGAILVALVTWYATDRRQRTALAAERERLALQLSHQRHLHDVADLREVLSDTLSAAEETFVLMERVVNALAKGPPAANARPGTVDKTDELLGAMRKSHRDLIVRFPRDDATLAAHRKLLDAFNAARRTLTPDGIEEFAIHKSEASDALRELVETAQRSHDIASAKPR
jgi:hypothetical protein